MYERLPYEDYFIICSDDYSHTDPEHQLKLAEYVSIPYKYKGRDYSVEYQVRYDKDRNCIQAIFQQTASKSDWRANFDFPSKIYDKITFDGKLIQLRCHRGWGNMWLVCQNAVRRQIALLLKNHPGAYIEVFGWSLGSGIAQLAAEDIYFKFGIKPYLYTYGSVKPFFGKNTYKYVQSCCEKVYNFYDHCDIVGYMVPLLGWRAINHKKVKLEKFCITKLFNPQKYHCTYYTKYLYDDID